MKRQIIGKVIPWEQIEEILDKKDLKTESAKYQESLICSHTMDDDFRLAKEGYTFLGILKEDNVIKQEIHVWGKN